MAEGFEKTKITLNNDYNGLKTTHPQSSGQNGIESFSETDCYSGENPNSVRMSQSNTTESVPFSNSDLGKVFRGLGIDINDSEDCSYIDGGYQTVDAKGNVFGADVNFTGKMLPFSIHDSYFHFENNLQIPTKIVTDISFGQEEYTISIDSSQNGQTLLPGGLYIDSGEVKKITVTEDKITLTLAGDGYLVLDKDGKVLDRRKPCYQIPPDKKNMVGIVQYYLKNVFFSWEDIIHPVVISTTTDSKNEKKYFSQETFESLCEREGITISGLDQHYDESYEISDKSGKNSYLKLSLLDFDSSINIKEKDFSVMRFFTLPTKAISDIHFNSDSYEISFRDRGKNDAFTCSYSDVSIDLCDISRVVVYKDYIEVHFKDGRTLTYKEYGELSGYSGDWKEEEINGIFSDLNYYAYQYGGDQHYFAYNVEELLEDEWVTDFLKEKYPDANELDYYLFFQQLTNCGCGYVAMSNFIFEQFEGKEDLFKEYFGYDMYTVNENGLKNYNYKYLTLELFSYYWSGHDITEIYDYLGKEIPNLTVENFDEKEKKIDECLDEYDDFDGSTILERAECLEKFLKEKLPSNFEYSYEELYFPYEKADALIGADKIVYDMTLNNIKKELEQGRFLELSASGYDLYLIDSTTGERGKRVHKNGGGHAMTITGVTKSGDLIVSTWGKKLIVDVSDAKRATIISETISEGSAK